MSKSVLSLAAIAFIGLGGSAVAKDPYGLGVERPVACAPGYHADAGGNCQPQAAEVSRFCAPGLVYEPDPNGWRCLPAPREAY